MLIQKYNDGTQIDGIKNLQKTLEEINSKRKILLLDD